MRIINENGEYLINYDMLQRYGFTKKDNSYVFEKNINSEFKVTIEIVDNTISTKVIEIIYDSEYLNVDVKSIDGSYVLMIKDAYESIIKDFISKCLIRNVFHFLQTKKVVEYIKNKYNSNPEFLWDKYDDIAVFRNDNGKWYGVLFTLSFDKLDNNKTGMVEIINLKYDRNGINEVVNNINVFRGYHMNKNNWITLVLDDTLSDEEVYKLIDNSYKLVYK